MTKPLLFLSLILLLISCDTPPTSTDHPEASTNAVADSLSAELSSMQSEGQIHGFSVAVVNEEGTLYEKGFGWADIDRKKSYTEHTIQNIASISKTLIGIALLKAQEMGKLNIDDPINQYLPYKVQNPYFPSEPITIRQLATHTSSISDGEIYDAKSYILSPKQDSSATRPMNRPDEFNPSDQKIAMQDFLQKVLSTEGEWYTKELFLKNKPGEWYEYTNVGATVAAAIIEYATNQSYDEFTTEHILKPLGMNTSGWSLDKIDFSLHTKLYADTIAQLPFYSLITYPDGGLISSSHDMSKYLTELIRAYQGKGSLLKPESYQALFSKYLNDSQFEERDADHPYNDEYDSGLFMGFSGQGYVGHSGGDPGVSTYMFFDAKKKIGRILLINTNLNNDQGVQQFFGIWEKLGEYQDRL